MEYSMWNIFVTEALDVLLEVLLLLLLVDGGEVHAVEPAVLLGLVPVRLYIDITLGHKSGKTSVFISILSGPESPQIITYPR